MLHHVHNPFGITTNSVRQHPDVPPLIPTAPTGIRVDIDGNSRGSGRDVRRHVRVLPDGIRVDADRFMNVVAHANVCVRERADLPRQIPTSFYVQTDWIGGLSRR